MLMNGEETLCKSDLILTSLPCSSEAKSRFITPELYSNISERPILLRKNYSKIRSLQQLCVEVVAASYQCYASLDSLPFFFINEIIDAMKDMKIPWTLDHILCLNETCPEIFKLCANIKHLDLSGSILFSLGTLISLSTFSLAHQLVNFFGSFESLMRFHFSASNSERLDECEWI